MERRAVKPCGQATGGVLEQKRGLGAGRRRPPARNSSTETGLYQDSRAAWLAAAVVSGAGFAGDGGLFRAHASGADLLAMATRTHQTAPSQG